MPSCTQEDLDLFLDDLKKYDMIFYKSLSTNDHAWYEDANKHQNAVLIPRQYFTFFGFDSYPLQNASYKIDVTWFLDGDSYTRRDVENPQNNYKTTIKYWRKNNRQKRPEIHLSNLYNPYFANLNDGSIFIVGRIPINNTNRYNAIIIDDNDILKKFKKTIDIPDGDPWGTIQLSKKTIDPDFFELDTYLEQKAKELYELCSGKPSTEMTSNAIWNLIRDNEELIREVVNCKGIHLANSPFKVSKKNAPGNLVRWMFTKAEFKLYKFIEKLHYPEIIVSAIRDEINDFPTSWEVLIEYTGQVLNKIISVSQSITNSRSSRAGYSFEWHISNLLESYEIKFKRQVGKKNIDFTIYYGENEYNLSAKTTAKERWKQIYDNFYFMTLDRNITKNTLENMKEKNITLVVPEEDK
ncbi:MAG: type II restriction endonuclease, partial [Candidatus Woesearchaeota archaeon]